MEQELRKKAIKRYLQVETPKSIYSDLGRSKNWFFKWLRRYQSGDCSWYRDQSRAPIRRPTALNNVDKQRIISVRQHLEWQKFAQTGVSAIKWELSKTGYSFPSDSTINRVLKREGFIKKKLLTSPRALSTPILLKPLRSTIFTRQI